MEVDRRGLMKGLLASGALLALGVPSWAFADQPVRRPSRCLLVLGDTGADEAFAKGARAACAGLTYEGLRTVKLKGGLLTGMDQLVTLLDQSRGGRMLAVMDDAGAMVFLELARTAGARLLVMGTHIGSTGNPCHLRHDWATALPAHGVGGLLAAQLADSQDEFAITESFLHDPFEAAGGLLSWSAPGFASYRVDDAEMIHLHCSGLSLSEGCGLVGLDTSKQWTPIPSLACARESRGRRSGNWVQSVGYAVTASALGVDSVRESCSSRAFIRRSRNGGPVHPMERFVSFVMDI